MSSAGMIFITSSSLVRCTTHNNCIVQETAARNEKLPGSSSTTMNYQRFISARAQFSSRTTVFLRIKHLRSEWHSCSTWGRAASDAVNVLKEQFKRCLPAGCLWNPGAGKLRNLLLAARDICVKSLVGTSLVLSFSQNSALQRTISSRVHASTSHSSHHAKTIGSSASPIPDWIH